MTNSSTKISDILKKYESELATEWIRELKLSGSGKEARISETELFTQAKGFINLLQVAVQSNSDSPTGPEWRPVLDFLEEVSRTRVAQGFASDETATFIFSFKKPLFARLRAEYGSDASVLADENWRATQLLDRLGMLTIRAFQKTREDVINRQQEEMLELSTPVVKLWDGILALPMIGTLDSARTQIVMESLLQKIVETGSEIAIIDITGVPVVDTYVAQYLISTTRAAQLLGCQTALVGIRGEIAQSIVQLGIDLSNLRTLANLRVALQWALDQRGLAIVDRASR